jgi:hypothetical protein
LELQDLWRMLPVLATELLQTLVLLLALRASQPPVLLLLLLPLPG